MTKYLVLDCEMGGVGKETSLLTAYFHIAGNENGNLSMQSPKLSLNIKHDFYNITAEGMSVNHIDIIEHDKIAEFKNVAGQKLFRFLEEQSNKGQDKLIPLGHGIDSDLNKIYEQLLGRKTWEQFCSYRKVDTGVIARFMQELGQLPTELDCSLKSLVDHFQIDLSMYTNEQLHTASTDTWATWLVYFEEYRTMKGVPIFMRPDFPPVLGSVPSLIPSPLSAD